LSPAAAGEARDWTADLSRRVRVSQQAGDTRCIGEARTASVSPGVDPIAVYDVQQIIVNLRKSGLAIMITDHNVRETLSIVDRAYLIYRWRVESEGTKDFLINDPISVSLTWANASNVMRIRNPNDE